MNLVSSFFHYGHELGIRFARQSSSESYSQSVVSQLFANFETSSKVELCPNTKEAAADTSLWSLDPIRMLYGVDEEDNDI